MGEATTPLKTERPERREMARVENRILFEFGLVSVGVEVVRLSGELLLGMKTISTT